MDIPMDLTEVSARVQEKRKIFEAYKFGPLKDDALKTFYDLAQEYETIENFYRVTVSVIKEFFDLDARLYLVSSEGRLDLVCDSLRGLYPDKTAPPAHISLTSKAYTADDSLILPIRGNLLLVNQLPFYAKEQLIGMLELYPGDRISAADRFFLEKYANRLGYNLHVKIVARQNIQHIRFINSLVADIEHNVIIPNISLSLYLRHLRNKIKNLKELECVCTIKSDQCTKQIDQCAKQIDAKGAFRGLIDDLEKDYDNLEQHYKGVSLFIESLFRLSHFQKGQFVLRRRTTQVTKGIIEPQLNLFIDQLKERHIEIDTGAGVMPDEDLPLSVDKGLMAQVYANLFSNAVKYARCNYEGRKYMAYGRDLLQNYFGLHKDGVKFNVFTTGPHLPPEDVPYIFDEGFRGTNIDGEVGTGRGLFFVRNVVETHGGEVGYQATPGGNNFYFVLPLVVTPEGPLPGELESPPAP